jgi:hypothetical protein
MKPENKHEIYQRAGLTNRLGFGQTPALIVAGGADYFYCHRI